MKKKKYSLAVENVQSLFENIHLCRDWYLIVPKSVYDYGPGRKYPENQSGLILSALVCEKCTRCSATLYPDTFFDTSTLTLSLVPLTSMLCYRCRPPYPVPSFIWDCRKELEYAVRDLIFIEKRKKAKEYGCSPQSMDGIIVPLTVTASDRLSRRPITEYVIVDPGEPIYEKFYRWRYDICAAEKKRIN